MVVLTSLQDWWLAVGHSEFHRKWNIAIYDFFRTYVHQEISSVSYPHVQCHVCVNTRFAFFQLMSPRYRRLAALFTFVLSAILHDMYSGICMGFFLPVFIIIYALNGGKAVSS